MWTATWLYDLRVYWDWLYIVPLSFSIIILSFSTVGAIYIAIRNTRQITTSLQNVVSALDKISSRLDSNNQELAKNTSELKEELGQHVKTGRDIISGIEENRQVMDGILELMDKAFWWVSKGVKS